MNKKYEKLEFDDEVLGILRKYITLDELGKNNKNFLMENKSEIKKININKKTINAAKEIALEKLIDYNYKKLNYNDSNKFYHYEVLNKESILQVWIDYFGFDKKIIKNVFEKVKNNIEYNIFLKKIEM